MAKMSQYTMSRLGIAAARKAEQAIESKQFMDENEKWAQEWFGCSYEEIRWKSISELEPTIDKWLDSLKTSAPQMRSGCIEVLEVAV